MKALLLGAARLVLWCLFALNVYVTLVLLSGGSLPIMNGVACVVLGGALAYNYIQFDVKGNLRERQTGENRPVVGIPVDVDRSDVSRLDLESFDWRNHRDSGVTGGTGSNGVDTPHSLGGGSASQDSSSDGD